MFAQNQSKPEAQPEWITISNGYANQLIQVVFDHHPEFGSQQGLAQYDTKVSQPTLADEDQERKETEAVLAKLQGGGGAAEAERSRGGPADHDPPREAGLQAARLRAGATRFRLLMPVSLYSAAFVSAARRADTRGAAARCRGASPRVCRARARLHGRLPKS